MRGIAGFRFILGIVVLACGCASVHRNKTAQGTIGRDEEVILAVLKTVVAEQKNTNVCLVFLWSRDGPVAPSKELLRRMHHDAGIADPPCGCELEVGPVRWHEDSRASVLAGRASPVGRCTYRVSKRFLGGWKVTKPPCVLE
jgi:hypothetical protein